MENPTRKLKLLAFKPIALLAFSVTIFTILLFSHSQLTVDPKSMASRSFILWLHGLGDSGPANEPIKTLFTSPQFANTRWSFPSAPSQPVTCNHDAVMPSWFDIHEIPITADDGLTWGTYANANGINEPRQHARQVMTSLSRSRTLLFDEDDPDEDLIVAEDDVVEIASTSKNKTEIGQSKGRVFQITTAEAKEIPDINSPMDESSLLKAVGNVHSVIDKELAGGIDPKNVFICGFSQGGALTLVSALLYPKTLGGGAVFSGWVPFNSTSVIEQISPEAKRTPILWSHGIADGTVLFEAGQAGPRFLQRAGINCEFKAYPGLAHSINNQELQHLESWIKSRLQSSS